MKPLHIPSPLPYLAEIPDPREYLQTAYEWEDLLLISLMALGSGRTHILAIAQWAQDHRDYLLNRRKLYNRYGEARLPAQATFYRFCWFLNEQLTALREAMLAWAMALGPTTPLAIAMDGKHLRGTRRGRKGQEALVFLSALVQGLGLSLGSLLEGQTAQVALVRMEGLAVDWVLTGDAGLTGQALAQAVVASWRSRITSQSSRSCWSGHGGATRRFLARGGAQWGGMAVPASGRGRRFCGFAVCLAARAAGAR